ncbi:MAG: transposase [Firmicutes bacterium]|jgi:transposase InsO family protein|nr:transposase [Bacillota bacterium]
MAQFYVTVDEDVMRAVFQEDGGYSFLDAYREVSEYMRYYNERRRHGSLGYMSPRQYHEAIRNNSIKPKVFVA